MALYYSIQREQPLKKNEAQALIAVFEKANSANTFYEPLVFYDSPTGLTDKENWILTGSSKVAPGKMKKAWEDIQEMCAALTECRRKVEGADWVVHFDDHTITWEAKDQEFAPWL